MLDWVLAMRVTLLIAMLITALVPAGSLGQPLFVCAGTEWLVPKSPVAFHSLGLLPVCIDSLLPRRQGWHGLVCAARKLITGVFTAMPVGDE